MGQHYDQEMTAVGLRNITAAIDFATSEQGSFIHLLRLYPSAAQLCAKHGLFEEAKTYYQ
jgi:hypothetical protein